MIASGDCRATVAGEELLVPQAGNFAIYSAKGHVRPDMQDAWAARTLTVRLQKAVISIPFFAVFDGHGDQLSALYLADFFSAEITRQIQAKCEEGFTDKGLWNSFKQAALEINSQICRRFTSGSVALSCLIIENVLWTLNVGDSRAILSSDSGYLGLSRDQTIAHCAAIGTSKMQALTTMRKRPQNANGAERDFMRMTRRGGLIQGGYVRCAQLALSRGVNMPRAFGNAAIAAGVRVLCAKPEITRIALQPDSSQLLILGCDGVWDCISSTHASQEAQKLLASGSKIPRICRVLGRKVSSAPQQKDNITLMVVQLDQFLATS